MHPTARSGLNNMAIGYGLGGVFLGMVLWFNIGGLTTWIASIKAGWLSLVPLWIMAGGIFTCLQLFLAWLSHNRDDDDEPRGGRRDFKDMQHDELAIRVRVDETRGEFWQKR